MSVELHLPDLPEVPISLGPARGAPMRTRMPWHLRLRDALSAYLPLLVMTVLALASWWLVKNSPRPVTTAADRPVSVEPDYTMSGFALERFDAGGRLRMRIEGARMRHFPATDRLEIDEARIHAVAEDGRVTQAVARQAIGNGDGSEVQLLGGAEVTSSDENGAPLVMRSEFLHAFLVTERVRSHLPVMVRLGVNEWRAGGLDYDHAARKLDLAGPMHAELTPRAAPVAKAAAR
ncbi:MAG: LPS export ABC transporter periplasmic protein LptC [Rubrivivax sp.]|nr:LPS export ABC transporter periplasmic protein LptC [Rubrivivax sp.]